MPYAIDRGAVVQLQFSNPNLSEEEKFDEAFIQHALENHFLHKERNVSQLEHFETQGIQADLLRWLRFIKGNAAKSNYKNFYRTYKSLILKHKLPVGVSELLIFDILLSELKNEDVIKEFNALGGRLKKEDTYRTQSYERLMSYYNQLKREHSVK